VKSVLPNFFVIGAMRCATTTLCDTLALHPDVFMTTPKELNYFSNDVMFAKGPGWYESFFAAAAGKAAVGEGSTNYTKVSLYPHAAERLAAQCADAKLIYIARDPIARIESHWLHLLRHGHDMPAIADALRQVPDMLATSLYWRQIGAYRRHFPDRQLLVVFFEDFVRAPAATMARVCEFLGLDPVETVTRARLHSNAYPDVPVDGTVLRFMRRLPGMRGVTRLQPASLRGLARKLKAPQPEASLWPADLRAETLRALRPDAEQFLAFCGKPADFWPLT
jgi:hypothetical protein